MRCFLNILRTLALMIFISVISACSKDTLADLPIDESGIAPTVRFSVVMQDSRANAMTDGFEAGTGLENFLDISRKNFRVYFFNSDDNTYISTFRPLVNSAGGEVDQSIIYYSFWGEVPKTLPGKFKIVVLFNWPEYPVETAGVLKYGNDEIKTIKDLCTHPYAQFPALTLDGDGEWLNTVDANRLIPFYGVREYVLADYISEKDKDENGELKAGTFIDLSRNGATDTSIPIIRSMAKVEVILEDPVLTFDAVKFSKVNHKGFCSPYRNDDSWNYDYSDYFQGYIYDADFVRGVHLTGGTNDTDPKDDVVFKRVNARTEMTDESGTNLVIPEKWVAYIPEYRNTGEGDNPSAIEVRLKALNSNGRDGDISEIYFSKDGKATGGMFDVERNNIYRFIVNVNYKNGQLDVKVDIQPYAEQIINFQFGLVRDGRGDLKVLPLGPELDEAGNPVTDENGNVIMIYPQYFVDFINDDNPKHKYPHAEDENGNPVQPEEYIKLEDGDYYAIVVGENDEMQDAVVWVKDKDECHVLSNFSSIVLDDSQDCSARLVETFFGNNQSEKFYKDMFGYRRVYHFANHNSIVRHPRVDNLLFRMIENFGQPNQSHKYYEVESWDEASLTGWIILKDENGEEKGFRKITSDGQLGESVYLDGKPFQL